MPANRFPYRPLAIANTSTISLVNTGVDSYVNFTTNNPVIEAGMCADINSVTLSKPATLTISAELPAGWTFTDTYNNNPIPFYAGPSYPNTTSQPFRICCPSSTTPRAYSLEPTATNSSFTFAKGILNVTVTKAVQIDINSVSAAAGGCSQVITATLPFRPTSIATLVVKYINGTAVQTIPSTITLTNIDLQKKFMVYGSTAGTTNVFTVEATSPEGLYKVASTSRPNITLTVNAAPKGTVRFAAMSLSLQKGGCSSLQTLSISSLPTTDIIVQFNS